MLQTLLLSHLNPVFAWLPVENWVHQHQVAYYEAIQASTAATDCAVFVRFMLERLHGAVAEAVAKMSVEMSVEIAARKQSAQPSQQVMNLLLQQPKLTLAEVALAIGRSTRTVERVATQLQAEGKLRFIGPRKGGQWEVTATLTL